MSEDLGYVKTVRGFLGVPVGAIGKIVKQPTFASVEVQFDCKDEPVLIGFPDSHYVHASTVESFK